MFWNEKCLLELTHHNLFESTEHRNRFRELLDCYYEAPFFTKGICKCMYLASWDELHFMQILSILNEMMISDSAALQKMRENGEALSRQAEGYEENIYALSLSFLTNSYYELPDFSRIDPETAHIIRRSILAASFIDDLPDPHADQTWQ